MRALLLNEIDKFVKQTDHVVVANDLKELSAELRPIIVKFRRVFGPVELVS